MTPLSINNNDASYDNNYVMTMMMTSTSV